PAAVRKLFNSWYALFLNRPHSDVVKYLHIDSWECGSQNWGYQFAEESKARRGYDLIPYLPIMAGVPMESASRYEQVLKDIR
ncbi:glycosyl hydrolase, partial [Enterococcus faecalis]|uniref:glycosyl hydrolase n=1 Tax=Enterococcus faecalis TaxID=1351 RepID=UPI003D6A777E